MEKIWNWIKNIESWNVGEWIMMVGVTIVAVAGIWALWASPDMTGPVKLAMSGLVVGAYGLFVMTFGLTR